MNLWEMSGAAWLSRKKTTVAATAALAGLLTMRLAAAIFLCLTKGFTPGLPVLAIPLSLAPVLLINTNAVRTVNKELPTRHPMR